MRPTLSKQIFFMVLQDAVLALSIGLAVTVRWLGPGPMYHFDLLHAHKLAGGILLFLVVKACLHYFQLYDISTHQSVRQFMLGLIRALLVALVLLSFVYYFDPPFVIGRGILALTVIVLLVTVPFFRFSYHYLSGEGGFTQNILVVGVGPAAKMVIDEIEKYQFSGFTVVGIVDDDADNLGREFEGYTIIGGFDQIRDLAESREVDTIVVALSEQRGRLPVDALIDCKLRGINVINDTSFHEQFTGKIIVESLRPSFFIFSDGFQLKRLTLFAKRLFDVVISVALLVLASPLILVAAVAVKLSSPGPILYRQQRAGLHGTPFHLYKFRSMVADSEKATGPVWAQKNDARVTGVGRVLRRFRIDELPQIYNILKGEMSFVGPRPERPFFVNQLAEMIPYYRQRLVIKPGLTGWAQIRLPYGNTVEDAKEKLQYDLYYIKNLSWLFDLKIISETTKVVLGKMGEGTY